MKSSSAFSLTLIVLVAFALTACVPLVAPAPAAPQPETAAETTPPQPATEVVPTGAPVATEAAEQPLSDETTTGLANPASVNCVDQGGALTIEQRGDGGEFGVCTFKGNRQCEEWALLRGYCLVGGTNVTGFVTPAARYCAITGGFYASSGGSGTETETGICTLPDGVECDVWDYYNGKCPA